MWELLNGDTMIIPGERCIYCNKEVDDAEIIYGVPIRINPETLEVTCASCQYEIETGN